MLFYILPILAKCISVMQPVRKNDGDHLVTWLPNCSRLATLPQSNLKSVFHFTDPRKMTRIIYLRKVGGFICDRLEEGGRR